MGNELGIAKLWTLPYECRANPRVIKMPLGARAPRALEDQELPAPAGGWSLSSVDYTKRFSSGEWSPVDAVTRSLRSREDLRSRGCDPIQAESRVSALREAEASAHRYRQKKPLGPLDGVPFVVKEQTAVRDLPLTSGTGYLDQAPQPEDAFCVAHLRRAGAIVIAHTVMTEFGLSPLGQNSQRTMPKNPHHTDHVAGGSSTGTGVAVATGMVPFGLGVDGGGSIRIPASVNGVFGLKPTKGRVSEHGDMLQVSVNHTGPIASSTADLARVMELISGTDAADVDSLAAPEFLPGSMMRALGRGVRGLTIGIDEGEWAIADSAIANAGRSAIDALVREGARVVPLKLRLAEHAARIGYVSIAIEALAGLAQVREVYGDRISPDLAMTLNILKHMPAEYFVVAQMLSAGLREEMSRAFTDIDVLALPSTIRTAPFANAREMKSGFLDSYALDSLCRTMFLGNLTGLPAITCPVGLDKKGLPIGLQFVGDAFDEATLLAISAHLERQQVAVVRRPGVTVNFQ